MAEPVHINTVSTGSSIDPVTEMPRSDGTLDVFPVHLPLMHPPSMKRLSPSLPDGPTFLRRSVVGSISNRGRNYEPAHLRSFCGQQNLKSHGVPRLIGGACQRIAAHVVRLPRLTLKAGRKAGSSVSKEAPFFAGSSRPRLPLFDPDKNVMLTGSTERS
jgi:hypothetical protein